MRSVRAWFHAGREHYQKEKSPAVRCGYATETVVKHVKADNAAIIETRMGFLQNGIHSPSCNKPFVMGWSAVRASQKRLRTGDLCM
jgi:hypothetical protein